jgi:hypothetical protein
VKGIFRLRKNIGTLDEHDADVNPTRGVMGAFEWQWIKTKQGLSFWRFSQEVDTESLCFSSLKKGCGVRKWQARRASVSSRQ